MNVWYSGTGPYGETALASFVTLSRNIAGLPFPVRLNLPQKNAVTAAVFAGVRKTLPRATLTQMNSLYPYEAVSLAERSVIPPDFASAADGAALITEEQTPFCVLLCGEDHVRIRAWCGGLDPAAAYETADKMESLLDGEFRFAFHPKLGFLNQDPLNIGTGMRAAAMLHLPALCKSGAIPALASTAGKLGFSLKGAYGSGIAVPGDLFSLENTVTMGLSEAQALSNLKSLCLQFANKERDAAEAMLEDPAALDRIHRSYALLTSATLLTAAETLELLSSVRLGALYNVVSADVQKLNALFVTVQPATVNCAAGKKIPAAERDAARAKLVKRTLAQPAGNAGNAT